jgi:hypothetical protein
MDWLVSEALIALATLTLLEIVRHRQYHFHLDLVGRLPSQRRRARLIGLGSMGTRILLLCC